VSQFSRPETNADLSEADAAPQKGGQPLKYNGVLAMVAEDRSEHNSRTEAIDIIDLGTWQEALVRALRQYNDSS
jgi:hypothetical protein